MVYKQRLYQKACLASVSRLGFVDELTSNKGEEFRVDHVFGKDVWGYIKDQLLLPAAVA